VTVSAVCRKVGITRQNYYARRQGRERRKVEAGLVVALVVAERKIQPRLGGRKLHFMLKGTLAQEGVKLGLDLIPLPLIPLPFGPLFIIPKQQSS
jgi:hypothetical protein